MSPPAAQPTTHWRRRQSLHCRQMASQIRFGTCNEMFEGWDLARQLAFLRECGYEGVELAPFTIDKDVRNVSAAARREVAAQAKAAGIEVIGLHWLLVG